MAHSGSRLGLHAIKAWRCPLDSMLASAPSPREGDLSGSAQAPTPPCSPGDPKAIDTHDLSSTLPVRALIVSLMHSAPNDSTEFDDPEVAQEYRRWIAAVQDSPNEARDRVKVHDVLRGHFVLLDYFSRTPGSTIGGVGPRDLGLLQSAVSRQDVSYGGTEKYPGPISRVATLFFGLIHNHPFHDANKRTALLIALYHLLRVGRTPSVGEVDLERLAVRTAAHELHQYARFAKFTKNRSRDDAEVAFLAGYLHTITRKVDNRQYFITYQQLDAILQRYGFCLGNHAGNYVDVLGTRTQKRWYGGSTNVKVSVCQIGCPTMKAQVGASALKTVRRATGLTVENGIDSQVFFGNQDPLGALVSRYENPLRRLADR